MSHSNEARTSEKPLVAVIMAGGTGTRLYPASTAHRPKPILALGADRSLLARTVDRVSFADEIYVLTRPSFTETVREVVPDVGILTEPAPKDTGPALVYAAARLSEQVGDCVLLSVPCDHHVDGPFEPTARQAARCARETAGLVTIGIEPDRPATRYGYITPEDEPGVTGGDWQPVSTFVEKPGKAAAREFVENGSYWNSGTFAWTPAALLSAAATTELAPLVDAMEAGQPEKGFEAVEVVSIDRAVLEKASSVSVVPASFDWGDVGTWNGLAETLDTDDRGNVTVGDAKTVDSEHCILASDESIRAIGISDLLIASYDGQTVVVPRNRASQVSQFAGENEDTDTEPSSNS